MTGTVAEARLYPGVIVEHPGLSIGANFRLVPNSYISGLNEGGEFPDGVSVEECAARCAEDPLCRSFDAGKPDGAKGGACYVSHESSVTRPDAVRSSVLFDLYERRF